MLIIDIITINQVPIRVHAMIIRFLLFSIFLIMTTSAIAAEQLLLDFKLTQGERNIGAGKVLVSQKLNIWSKGVKRSYLKLRCQQLKTGKVEKLYSTADHFDGLQITHQLVEGKLELIVVRNTVQPRLVEIRALSKKECRDMSPVVSTTTETYSFPAKDGINESRPFGENMTFWANILSISKLH